MAVVVRCTGCGGLARVGPEAVGLLVVCPRCHDPFLADPVPEPALAASPPPPPPRPVRAQPVAPPPPPRRRRAAPEVHDHPPTDAGGVPFSVIIGLALLPLTIPMLWLIGPVAVGNQASLTLATPVSLAVAAAVLCLAVAYTVDWSPVTRIKGVLTLVGLAFFTGMFLYFMKRDQAEWLQAKLGSAEWQHFAPADHTFSVEVPGEPNPVPAGARGPVAALDHLTHFQVRARKANREATYVVAAGADHDPRAPDVAWFAAIGQSLKDSRPGWQVGPGQAVPRETLPSHEWELTSKGGERLIVRVVRNPPKGHAYLLAVEGRRVSRQDGDAKRFLESFQLDTDD